MFEEIGFVFGNGTSRLKYDISNFLVDYPNIGCNAIYRDYPLDLVVCVNQTMLEEIRSSEYTGSVIGPSTEGKYLCSFFRRKKEDFWQCKRLKLNYGWSAGPTAVRLLCEIFQNSSPPLRKVNLLGFDLYGISNKVNNIYTGTHTYQKIDSPAPSCENWVKHLLEVFCTFPQIRFFRVGNVEDTFPEAWKNIANIEFVEEPAL